jgi:hypothetical protein
VREQIEAGELKGDETLEAQATVDRARPPCVTWSFSGPITCPDYRMRRPISVAS